ncbi:helix-turn-helix domain-containing protein [Geomonas sp. Red32]|uniref:helix-turn-helix domain-containing protein n=1 Tax=Geomonas sp. Red32 TaxID=2912856 RepID=UPI00202CEB61|nr:helix-turn-helix domain-containing protein [Geomonas sp. Red32]
MDRLDTKEKHQIAVLAAEGKSPHAIGKVLGRSHNTISKALKTPEVAEQKEDIQARLADKFEAITERILDGVTPVDIEKASLRDKAVAAGVMLDKSRVIRGQSTQNIAVMMAAAVLDAHRLPSDGATADVLEAEVVTGQAEG